MTQLSMKRSIFRGGGAILNTFVNRRGNGRTYGGRADAFNGVGNIITI